VLYAEVTTDNQGNPTYTTYCGRHAPNYNHVYTGWKLPADCATCGEHITDGYEFGSCKHGERNGAIQ